MRCHLCCATPRPGLVLMATCAAAEHLDETRALLGDDQVLVLGQHHVDLAALSSPGRPRLPEPAQRGRTQLLSGLLAEGVVDELDLTVVPRLLAGEHPGSRTARRSTYPSSSRCCSRTAGRCWGAG